MWATYVAATEVSKPPGMKSGKEGGGQQQGKVKTVTAEEAATQGGRKKP